MGRLPSYRVHRQGYVTERVGRATEAYLDRGTAWTRNIPPPTLRDEVEPERCSFSAFLPVFIPNLKDDDKADRILSQPADPIDALPCMVVIGQKVQNESEYIIAGIHCFDADRALSALCGDGFDYDTLL